MTREYGMTSLQGIKLKVTKSFVLNEGHEFAGAAVLGGGDAVESKSSGIILSD
jgi:hypothetical protein